MLAWRADFGGTVITTYDLRDSGSHQALADELRARGCTVEFGSGGDDEVLMMVTHEVDAAGGLDALVYAAAPPADIVTTDLVRRARPAEAEADPDRTDIA